jgi:hypothetical protein
MLKSISKSNISRRSFQVYKKFTASDSDYPVLTASASLDDANHSLYRSIQAKYYTDNGVVNNFGILRNPADFAIERSFPDKIYVLKLDQIKYGEGIKPLSLQLTPDSSVTLTDDGFGKVISPTPSYGIVELDIENETLTLTQNGISYTLDIQEADFNIGNDNLLVIDGGIPERYTILSMDMEAGVLILTDPLDIDELGLYEAAIGNIFYKEGLIVFTQPDSIDLTNYSMEYRSTQTLHETEVLIEVKAGEFNFSQNPSAVDVVLSGSYDFTTTPITNVSPAKTVKIKEVQDISQRTSYTGSIGSAVGTWDDYFTYKLTDPTGSYLAPYITTIGLYDKDGDMVAIAKLPQPIKNLPDYNMNFIVRFDT